MGAIIDLQLEASGGISEFQVDVVAVLVVKVIQVVLEPRDDRLRIKRAFLMHALDMLRAVCVTLKQREGIKKIC